MRPTVRPFEPGSRPPDLQRLLENTSWVRRLAVRLLCDPSQADDILQEVLITAIERPPSKPEALRAWLGAVVRSLCRRANRSFLRRRRLDRGGEPCEPMAQAPSAEEIEERLEGQRRLLAAVLSLDEPYRSVVYLHFYEGLKLVTIARLRGISDSTVRTQLARGLDKLRGRLERDCGGGEKARALLLALVLPADLFLIDRAAAAATSPASGPSPVAGAPPRQPRLAILAAAAGALFLAVSSLWWTSSGAGSDPVQTVNAALPAVAPSRASPNVPHALARPDQPAPAPAAVTIPQAASAVCVLVVDAARGQPVNGAKVYRAPRLDPRSYPIGETSADGTLLVSDPAALLDPWLVVADGFVERREPAARRGADGATYVVELEAEFPARVLVLNADGSPAAGVPVTLHASRRGLGAVESVTVTTDRAGEAGYTYRHLDTSIRIDWPGHVSLALPAETPRRTVRLRPGRRFDGLVVGPGGEAVPACRVRLASSSLKVPGTAVTDSGGAFSLGVLDPDEEITARFQAPGLPAWRVTGRPPPAGPWRFELPRGTKLAGVVLAPGGGPAAGGHVFILVPEAAGDEGPQGPAPQVRAAGLPAAEWGTRRLVTRARAAIDDTGGFTLDAIAASEAEAYLFVHHPDHGRHLERLETLPAGATLEIHLPRGARLAGIVTLPDGEPLGGVLLHFGEVWSNGIECVIGRARAAADGSFAFSGLPEGIGQPLPGAWDGGEVVRAGVLVQAFAPHVLLGVTGAGVTGAGDVDAGGGEAAEERPGAFDVSGALAGAGTLRLTAAPKERLASLDVRLRDPAGLPVRAWTRAVVLGADGAAHAGVLCRNLREPRFFVDGTLAVERLDGAEIVLLPEGHRWLSLPGLDLRESAVLEVALEPLDGSPWRLRVRRTDGSPAAGWPVLAGLPFGAPSPRAAAALGRTDAEGALAIAFLPPGAHAIGIPFAGEDVRGEVLGGEQLGDRVSWSLMPVLAGGSQEATVPVRE